MRRQVAQPRENDRFVRIQTELLRLAAALEQVDRATGKWCSPPSHRAAACRDRFRARTGWSESDVLAARRRTGLRVVDQARSVEARSPRAQIADLDHRRRGQLVLEAHTDLIDARNLQVRVDGGKTRERLRAPAARTRSRRQAWRRCSRGSLERPAGRYAPGCTRDSCPGTSRRCRLPRAARSSLRPATTRRRSAARGCCCRCRRGLWDTRSGRRRTRPARPC